MNLKITAHCLIKNEDQWIWFAIQSVLPFVEKVLVYDTGSQDETVNVIKKINNQKIIFEEKGVVTKVGLVRLRQEMIERTRTEWFLILDGDEVWPEDSLKNTIEVAKKAPKNVAAVFNPVRNCIGDVFHYLPATEGKYQIKGKSGNFNIRFIKKTSSMEVIGEYPLEVYLDKNGPVQNQEENIVYSDNWYLHTSFLKRSSKDSQKVSGSFGKNKSSLLFRNKIWQKGIKMEENDLPKVFFLNYPEFVNNPVKKRGFIYEVCSSILDPLIALKRKIS